jgi:hypothetical protein
MKLRAWLGLWTLALILAGSKDVKADTLFSNFGPGDAYNAASGWSISTANSLAGAAFVQGEAFTPSITAQLYTIRAAINHISGKNEIILRVATDEAGHPGTTLETFDLVGQMGKFGSLNAPLTFTSVSRPLLTAGQRYWLVGFGTGDTWAAWNWNSIADTGPHARSGDDGSRYTITTDVRGAFEVQGGPDGPRLTPEPATGTLLCLGTIGLLGLAWRRRRAPRLTPQPLADETPR